MIALLLPLAHALSVETLAGPERASVDTMFFHFLPTRDEEGEGHSARPPAPLELVASRLLLFQRARGTFGWEPDAAPQLGITTALSWNPTALHGVAPVVVGQVLSTGPVARAGVQYALVRPRGTVFGWAVVELAATPAVDTFLLGRYTHPLSERVGVSVAGEVLVTVPTDPAGARSLTERARLGLALGDWQVGPGVDLSQAQGEPWTTVVYPGAFVRVEL